MQQGLVWPGSNSSNRFLNNRANHDHAFLDRWLRNGEVHEWSLSSDLCSKNNRLWFAPLSLLSAILNSHAVKYSNVSPNAAPFIAWIGKAAWPCPAALQQIKSEPSTIPVCLFIDPKTKNDRLWATLTSLRSPIVNTVVADTSGFNFTSTRRLCLAARKSSSLCICVRPSWEAEAPSAAQTKWSVSPLPQEDEQDLEAIHWLVTLNRARGLSTPTYWIVGITSTGEVSARHVDKARFENTQKAQETKTPFSITK
jgi:hypothetical protein